MSWFNNAELLRIAATQPAAVSAALGFIRGLQSAGKITSASVREIASNAEVLSRLGAHPDLGVSDLLLVVRWLLRMAQQDPDSLRGSLKKMQEDLGE